MELEKIIIYTRGINRDESGNPYSAYKIILEYSYKSFFDKVIICQSATYTNNSEKDGCLDSALSGINEFLWNIAYPDYRPGSIPSIIKNNDERIEHHHKHVYRFKDLENPENWKQ